MRRAWSLRTRHDQLDDARGEVDAGTSQRFAAPDDGCHRDPRVESPLTAEELRQAFTKKRRAPEPEPPRSEFESVYDFDSLFIKPGEDVHDAAGTDPTGPQQPPVGSYYYDPEDPWAVLGVDHGASWDDVVNAHRRLAMLHHPDRLLDVDENERRRSEDRMIEVNIAYSILRRQVGR